VSEEALRHNFGKVHALHVAALARHLIACRKVCDGDLDLFLVLTIIGERTFSPRNAPASMTHDAFLSGTVRDVEPEAINLQSIADYSGIPRETVRRKIEVLIEKGWVERDARRFVTATDKANESLRGLTASTLRYLREVEAALAAGDGS
jgi:DNA-binding MarR family transcriptional regulator